MDEDRVIKRRFAAAVQYYGISYIGEHPDKIQLAGPLATMNRQYLLLGHLWSHGTCSSPLNSLSFDYCGYNAIADKRL